ncbi:MAG: His/Gly/Thr/Pro-type tRNA ligase C-terminal domain-containing protein, partial [Patescibacteria group bacterium]
IFKTKEAAAKYLRRLGRGFDVSYVDREGKEKHCVMIHRVVLGSMERFFGILIEHYGGAFPTWLAPVQVVVIPIAERHTQAGKQAVDALKKASLRVEIDERNDTMQAKIRDATLQKVPYMGIIGDKEVDGGTVSVRTRSGEDLGLMPVEAFVSILQEKIESGT